MYSKIRWVFYVVSGMFKKTQKRQRDLLAAIDVGGNKVCCTIAKINPRNNSLKIIGTGHQISKGVKSGMITNLELLEDSILNAVHSAEQIAQETIRDVYVSLPPLSARSCKIDVSVNLGSYPVDDSHIRRLISQARGAFAEEGQHIVHAIPVTYALDQQIGIKDPRGLLGEKLSASIHLVSVHKTIIQNLSNCIGRCHLDVAGFVLTPYASGLATLVEDELALGATVVDLGGDMTSIASFLDGALVHVDSIPLGGMHITSDIARGLSTPLTQAERLKTLYGTVISSLTDDRETIMVQQLGDGQHAQVHHIPKSLLTRIIKARAEEILELVWKQLAAAGMDRFACHRIVLTGGGSQLSGVRDMASSLWNKQVRIGNPLVIPGGGESFTAPLFSTSAGLLQYALKDTQSNEGRPFVVKDGKGFIASVSQWVRENF